MQHETTSRRDGERTVALPIGPEAAITVLRALLRQHSRGKSHVVTALRVRRVQRSPRARVGPYRAGTTPAIYEFTLHGHERRTLRNAYTVLGRITGDVGGCRVSLRIPEPAPPVLDPAAASLPALVYTGTTAATIIRRTIRQFESDTDAHAL